VTDPAVHARLTALHDRLTQPTPAPLDGQQTIDDTHDPDTPERPGDGPTQPPLPLWT
jgi:hypothetical protein